MPRSGQDPVRSVKDYLRQGEKHQVPAEITSDLRSLLERLARGRQTEGRIEFSAGLQAVIRNFPLP